ncbi:hypothetical protein B4U79_12471, partial [Dinothrombium tinctorium]
THRSVVFSGIQPTGSIHLGNYFGAIRQWVDLQNDESKCCIFSVADLHSITMRTEPEQLKSNIKLVTATLLASGLDPEKCILFQQSSVSQHTLFSWILGCFSTMAELRHLPHFKEKSATLKTVPLGLYVYPVLQTADILLYKANEVPIGEDNMPHLAFAQHLCNKFNNIFKETFPVPMPVTIEPAFAARIKSLRNPTKKMSKSEPDSKSRIDLTDEPDIITEKIKKALTDFNSTVTFDPVNRPGVSNLIIIHSLLTQTPVEKICENSRNLTTAQYKLILADVIIEHFKPIRRKMAELLDDQIYLNTVLNEGAIKASVIAERTIREVKEAMGFVLS